MNQRQQKKRPEMQQQRHNSTLSSMTQDVKLHIQARYPLIYLVSWEEERVVEEI
ncbi:MAG: hypothetical protein GY801_30270, partial [bacterium]|nr:hypothetical protein [bacterium]